jgi:hypothetical protein
MSQEAFEMQRSADRIAFEKREQNEASTAGMSLDEYRAQCRSEEKRRDVAKENKNTEEVLASAGVPQRAIEAMVGSVLGTDAMRQCMRDDAILVLAGGPGRGKSVAACAWLMFSATGMRWVSAGSLSRGVAYDEEAFQKLVRVGRLVIDDVGTEYQDNKDRYLATLMELIDARFGMVRPTLITTNLTPAVFAERYGERLTSRINEDGAFVVCLGDDLRRTKATP